MSAHPWTPEMVDAMTRSSRFTKRARLYEKARQKTSPLVREERVDALMESLELTALDDEMKTLSTAGVQPA